MSTLAQIYLRGPAQIKKCWHYGKSWQRCDVVSTVCPIMNDIGVEQVKADAKKFIESIKRREQEALSAASEATAKISSLEAEHVSLQSKVEELTRALQLAEEEDKKVTDELKVKLDLKSLGLLLMFCSGEI